MRSAEGGTGWVGVYTAEPSRSRGRFDLIVFAALVAAMFVLGAFYGVAGALGLVTSECSKSGGFSYRGKTYTCQPEPVRKVEKLML